MSRLIIKGLIGGAVQVAIYAAALLIPAGIVHGGTWYWPRALLFFLLYAIALEASVVVMAIAAPNSLAARLTPPATEAQPMADRVATLLLVLATLGWFAFVAVDVFDLKLLPPPSWGVSLAGAVVSFAGFIVAVTAIHQNAFAIPIVEDQSARAQVVITSGLYAYVRHPMYLGILIFHAGLALWLGSYAALLAVGVMVLMLRIRIGIEETTLRQTLPEYPQYITRVPARLVPGIW
ncbi:MAG TPA: isoprenylcysteine carboxylmethyltransferase family protein [Gemmatimonadales bacterium]|jgi:protein-S-isoprenylcysteine O-methyltransferase Ste14